MSEETSEPCQSCEQLRRELAATRAMLLATAEAAATHLKDKLEAAGG